LRYRDTDMEAVFGWVATYGYGALFFLLVLGIVGLPIPDETLLVFCGYLISKGKLSAPGTYLAALAGSCCGITVSYFIGRTAGLGVVHRFGKYLHVNEGQLERVHRWFDRRGHWALLFGYYVAGIRHFTAIIAGASKLEFYAFAIFAWTGAATWVAVFLTLGYVIGEQWRSVAETVHGYVTEASLVGIALAGLFFGVRWIMRRRRRTPDSKY
jgi:membrane protein DedA with SNARE-associated domain